jgi:hypothetical protein
MSALNARNPLVIAFTIMGRFSSAFRYAFHMPLLLTGGVELVERLLSCGGDGLMNILRRMPKV